MAKKKKRRSKPAAKPSRSNAPDARPSAAPPPDAQDGRKPLFAKLHPFAEKAVRLLGDKRFLIPLLAVFIFCVHRPALDAYYFLDDFKYIDGNERVQDFSKLFAAWPDWIGYRGIVQLSFAIDWHLFSGSRTGMHFSSILYHIIAALLVWKLWIEIQRCFNPGQDVGSSTIPAALTAVLFFAIHPLATQPVCHLISRSNILVTIFYLLGTIVSLIVLRKKILPADTLRAATGSLLLQFVCMSVFAVLGMASKIIVITLPCMVLIANTLALGNRSVKHRIIYGLIFVIPYILMIGAYLSFRKYLFGSFLGFGDIEFRSFTVNALTQSVVVFFYYLPRVFLPINLHYDPFFPEYASLWNAQVLISITLLAVLFVAAFLCRRKAPAIAFGILWFFVTLSPTSSFLPLIDVVAERRVYLSLIGIALIAATVLHGWLSRHPPRVAKRFVYTALVLFVAAFSVMSYGRSKDFTDYYTLAVKDINQQHPHGTIKPRTVVYFIGGALDDKKVERAYDFLEEKNFNYDILVEFLFSKGTVEYNDFDNFLKFLTFSGKHTESLKRFIDRYFKENMTDITMLVNLQNVFVSSGDFTEAERIVDYTLNLAPDNMDSLLNKANIYKTRGDTPNIYKYIKMAVDRHPQSRLPLQHLINFFEVNGLDTTQLKQRMNELPEEDMRYTKTLNENGS